MQYGHLTREMPMLDLLDADAATGDTQKSAAPDTKAAIKYLEASGATAIYVTCPRDFTAIRIGQIAANAYAVFWVQKKQAVALGRRARKLAGDNPDREDAIAALREAAAELGVTLTEHATAISRAGAAVERLDTFIDGLRKAEFTKEYRRRRLAAREAGEGFVTYKVAERRLKAALVPLLMNGGKPAVGQSLFAEVFGGQK
jgi:hypothetical protein